jgi:2-methylcitrate dehydratase PrpD
MATSFWSMPRPTSVWVSRLTVDFGSPVRSASSSLPSNSDPSRNARRISTPRSGHTFAAIDGALALQHLHGFSHADIASVHLGVYRPTLDIAPHVDPQNADQARFSLHYMVASALVHGSVRLSAFEPARLNDAATRALMQRITKALDPEVDARFPGRRAARVAITLREGRVLTHLQPDRKGDPELPLSDADLEGKLIELAAPVIGEPEALALQARIWALTTSPNLST